MDNGGGFALWFRELANFWPASCLTDATHLERLVHKEESRSIYAVDKWNLVQCRSRTIYGNSTFTVRCGWQQCISFVARMDLVR